MLGRPVLVALGLGLTVASCGRDLGPPRVKSMPALDRKTALRGGGAARSSRNASYKIDARLDAARHQIVASEVLTWTNTGDSAVDMLPFHLYLNAFKNDSSLFMRSSGGQLRGAHASDAGWGWIQIDSVQISGVEMAGQLRFPDAVDCKDPAKICDETVAELPLVQPVGPGETIDVAFKFTDQLPEVFARTGYKGDFTMVGQWFPKIGVRTGPPGAERWECRPMHANTEFFADFGVYDVTLTVPNTHTVAATGVLVAAKESPGGTRILTYHAEDVHDFAWMADPYILKPITGTAKVEDGTVEVRVYARPEQAEFARRHLEAAIGAIERFSADFLPYPYPIMSVIDPPVDAASGAGGMEYPTLVTTAGDSVFFRPGIRIPEYVTIHEVGHNWFQGMLASNEPEEAWLDEGVNEWADVHVMTELYGPRTSIVDWMGWQADVVALRSAVDSESLPLPSPIATAAYAFVDTAAYGAASYVETMRALETLTREVGTPKFMAAMKAYAGAWAFKHPTGRDLFAMLETQLGLDLSWMVGPMFHEVGGMKLAIRTASCWPAHPPRGVFGEGSLKKVMTETEAPEAGAFVCEVVVQNTGVVHVPVDIELRFADGSAQRVHWDDRGAGNWERFVVERSSKLVELRIDPDDKLVLSSPIRHHLRLDANGFASMRASARIASWAQTLMQIVGP